MKKKLITVFVNLAFLLTGWFASLFFHSGSVLFSEQENISKTISSDKVDNSYLVALENLLSDYEDKLASLADVNTLLQSRLAFFDNQKTLMSALPSLRKKIQYMSEEDAKDKVNSIFKHKHQLKEVKDYKSFALRFMDLAVEEDTIPENISDADYLTDVRISISRSSLYMDVSDDNFEMSKYYKLYANIASSPPLKSVMLKWSNLTTGEVIKYIPFGTQAENDIEYVWAKPKAGWEVGTYQVSLHKLNDPMTLIARKLYRITSVIDEGEMPVYDGPTGVWSRGK